MGIVRELCVYPRLLTRILPLVERELEGWREAAGAIPDADLRKQALASIKKKKFHCVGGSVLALMADGNRDTVAELVRAIVAIQTISDYLDNLCDRSLVAVRVAGHAGGSLHDVGRPSGGNGSNLYEQQRENLPGWAARPYAAFLQLHESMLCAVDPERPVSDYYAGYLPLVEGAPGEAAPDGGYLNALVEASRKTLRGLPGYWAARPLALKLVSLYSELQAGKHMPLAVRDEIMERWFLARYLRLAQPIWPDQPSEYNTPHRPPSSIWPDQPPEPWLRQSGAAVRWLGRDLCWWEFGAATGSTLAVFALLCASANPAFSAKQARALAAAYFPSICGLHILLDYYIDQAEDVDGGDLNFISYYGSPSEATRALEGFTRWALNEAQRCPSYNWLHTAVVRGLLAMYLSDPKVGRQGLGGSASVLTRACRGVTSPLRTACSLARKVFHF